MGKILMENVVESICRKCVIREIPGMKRCVKMPKKKDTDPTVMSYLLSTPNDQKLVAEGRNLQGLWELSDFVDLNSLFSNDIGAIMDTYGVEAGRATIINEIKGIFSMYIFPFHPFSDIQVLDYGGSASLESDCRLYDVWRRLQTVQSVGIGFERLTVPENVF